MAAKSDTLFGRLPGQRKWLPLHVETTAKELHIYECHGWTKGRQLRTLQLGPGDMVGEERCKRKKRHKFYVQRGDGKYIFKCLTDDPQDREQWIKNLQMVIDNQTRFDEEENASTSPDPSRRNHIATPQIQSMPKQAYLERYVWFWGQISRQVCEQRLFTEGCQGNFVVRINADGDYVMSIWRPDGIRHHKIVYTNSMFCFQGSVLHAEVPTLLELLESYMSASTDKNTMPLGGWLYALKDEGTQSGPARYQLSTESPIIDSGRAPANNLHEPSPTTATKNFYTPALPHDATAVPSSTFGQTTKVKSFPKNSSLPGRQMFRTPPVTKRPLLPPNLRPPQPMSLSLHQLPHSDTHSLPRNQMSKTPPATRKPLVPLDPHTPVPMSSSLHQLPHSDTHPLPRNQMSKTPPATRKPLVPLDPHTPMLMSSSLHQLSHFDTHCLPVKRKFKTPPVARKPLIPPAQHTPVPMSASLQQLSTVGQEEELSHMHYANWSTITKSRQAHDAMSKRTMEEQTPYYMNVTHN